MKGGLRISPRNSRRAGERGFTIVESLIVLAVSGVIFLSIVGAISGRQNSTEFSQAVQNTRAQIEQFVNEVSSGYYPNGQDFNCAAPGGLLNISPTTAGSANAAQGSSKGCILVGKFLHFSSTSGTTSFEGYPVAGRQVDENGVLVSTIDDATPKLIAPTVAGTPTDDYAGEIQNFPLQYGLTVVYMCYGSCTPANPTPATASVGFMSLGETAATGSQAINVLPVYANSSPNTSLNNTRYQEVRAINGFLGNPSVVASMLNPAGGVHICFASGGTKQSALIDIGGNGRTVSVDATVKYSTDCT